MQKMIKRMIIVCLLAMILCVFPIAVMAELRIHFINVGQGDSILIQCDGETMLVDAGPLEAGSVVNEYIRNTTGIKTLNYVIATHSHDDHLFGMPEALKGLSVEKVYSSPSISLTYWFSEILPRLRNKDMIVVSPQSEEAFTLGGAEVQFINTPTASENENDHSIACKIVYGENSVLLTADIEGEAEISMLNAGVNLQADVLKVAHHGGNTSTCDAFLNAVNPQYAVISVGTDNPHGHPHQVVLDRLKKKNAIIYRTDYYGTIIAVSDGHEWNFEVMKAR